MPTTLDPGVADAADHTTTRLNCRLPLKTYQRLMISCVMLRRQPGELLAELIEDTLKDYTMPHVNTPRRPRQSKRAAQATEEGSANSGGGVSLAADKAA